jgi:hypothetical protein
MGPLRVVRLAASINGFFRDDKQSVKIFRTSTTLSQARTQRRLEQRSIRVNATATTKPGTITDASTQRSPWESIFVQRRIATLSANQASMLTARNKTGLFARARANSILSGNNTNIWYRSPIISAGVTSSNSSHQIVWALLRLQFLGKRKIDCGSS